MPQFFTAHQATDQCMAALANIQYEAVDARIKLQRYVDDGGYLERDIDSMDDDEVVAIINRLDEAGEL